MDTIQAAILLAKFEVFPDEVKLRMEIGARYSELLKEKVIVPYIEPFNTSVYAQYTIQVENRDLLQAKLNEAGVPTAVHYPIPLHLQPVFAFLNHQEGSFPVAENLAKRVLSLPMHPYLKEEDQIKISRAISEFSCNY